MRLTADGQGECSMAPRNSSKRREKASSRHHPITRWEPEFIAPTLSTRCRCVSGQRVRRLARDGSGHQPSFALTICLEHQPRHFSSKQAHMETPLRVCSRGDHLRVSCPPNAGWTPQSHLGVATPRCSCRSDARSASPMAPHRRATDAAALTPRCRARRTKTGPTNRRERRDALRGRQPHR